MKQRKGDHVPVLGKVLKKLHSWDPESICSETGAVEEPWGPRLDTHSERNIPQLPIGQKARRALFAVLLVNVRTACYTVTMPITD